MRTRRLVPVDESGPLSAVRGLLARVWEGAALDAMLVPAWDEARHGLEPALLESPAQLGRADPFAPVMRLNSARHAADVLRGNPGARHGLVLRPCELRSLSEIARRETLVLEGAFLIGPDCLATFPHEDFDWRSAHAEDAERLTLDALHFASQGGILPSRLRGSCQLCDRPYPEDADVHIEVLGLETAQSLVVNMRNEALAGRLGWNGGDIPPELVERRERVLARLASWRQRSRAFAESHLEPGQATVPALVEHIRGCIACREHLLEACPLFGEAWKQSSEGEDEAAVQAWLQGCGGCGMCDYACPVGYPLFSVVTHLGTRLRSPQAA